MAGSSGGTRSGCRDCEAEPKGKLQEEGDSEVILRVTFDFVGQPQENSHLTVPKAVRDALGLRVDGDAPRRLPRAEHGAPGE
jgi:hypothetical protein